MVSSEHLQRGMEEREEDIPGMLGIDVLIRSTLSIFNLIRVEIFSCFHDRCIFAHLDLGSFGCGLSVRIEGNFRCLALAAFDGRSRGVGGCWLFTLGGDSGSS